MAEGLTDRGIATRLTVSVRTAEAHVEAIFRKLDLPASPNDNRRVHAVLAYLRN
jgi:DNA-binding NarL/FixJ family response regulator